MNYEFTGKIVENDDETYILFPEEVLDKLGFSVGTKVDVHVEDGNLIIKKVEI